MRILAVRPLADRAVTLDLADPPGTAAARIVGAALATVERAIDSGGLPGVEDVGAAFCSITLYYDPCRTTQDEMIAAVLRLLDPVEPAGDTAGRLWQLPCCYDAQAGIDLPDLARTLDLPEDEIGARHAAVTFRVHALGFLPGLPFLGELPPELARPRRTEPRTAVPAGSVAIANRMCVIYPWVSPGGWHIVGACPVPLFDAGRAVPALLAVGDRVRFAPVDRATFATIRADAAAGRLDVARYRAGDGADG